MSHDQLAPNPGPAARKWWRVIITCTLALGLLAACESTESGSNAAVQITLLLDSAASTTNTVGIQLRNTEQAPITDATVKIEGNMNHAGMVPVMTEAVHDGDDGTEDGIYHLPFQFYMLGDWIISVDATLADGSQVFKDIHASVTEAGTQIHGD